MKISTLLYTLVGGITLCEAASVLQQRDASTIGNKGTLLCTEANYGGNCVTTNDATVELCNERNGQGYGLKGSIKLGSSLSCNFYQAAACEGSKVIKSITAGNPILPDFTHPYWITAGFVKGGPGPQSWRCTSK